MLGHLGQLRTLTSMGTHVGTTDLAIRPISVTLFPAPLDSTKYGTARVSPRSYYTHHTQRVSAAAVRADAKNARVQIACLKQRVCAAA